MGCELTTGRLDKPTMPTPYIRWMKLDDISEVNHIEVQSFDYPWTEDDFEACFGERKILGIVAELDCRVAGYAMYNCPGNVLRLYDLAVHPKKRRHGIGTVLVDELKKKVRSMERRKIVCDVRETNLDGQQFFKAMGFRATEVARRYFADTREDAFVMEWRVGK